MEYITKLCSQASCQVPFCASPRVSDEISTDMNNRTHYNTAETVIALNKVGQPAKERCVADA